MRNISIGKRQNKVNSVLESLGLLLVGLRDVRGAVALQELRRRYILLRVRKGAPLLSELGGDVLDGQTGVGLLDLPRSREIR